MRPIEQVIALLPKLARDELDEVRARCGALCQGSALKMAGTGPLAVLHGLTDDEQLVCEMLALHLQERGLAFAGPEQLRKTQGFAAFRMKVPATMVFFRKATKNKVKLRALLTTVCALLFEDLTKQRIAPSIRVMLAHWHRTPGILDRAFPGYARNGLLPLLIGESLSYVKRQSNLEDKPDVRS